MFMTAEQMPWIQALHLYLAVQTQVVSSCLSSACLPLAWDDLTSQTRCVGSSVSSQDSGEKGRWMFVSSRPAMCRVRPGFKNTPAQSLLCRQQFWPSPCPLVPSCSPSPYWWMGRGSSVQVLFGWASLLLSCLEMGASGLGWRRKLRGRQALNPGWLGSCNLTLKGQESVPVYRVCIFKWTSCLVHDGFTC